MIPDVNFFVVQKSVCTTDKLTDRDRNGMMAVTRNVYVWTPKLDTIAVDRGNMSFDLFDKMLSKMHYILQVLNS